MSRGVLGDIWRSGFLRILMLSAKLSLILFITMLVALDVTAVFNIPNTVMFVLMVLVVIWNIAWIVGAKHSLRVHLILHGAEIAILSVSLVMVVPILASPLLIAGIAFSCIHFATKIGDAVSTTPSSIAFREQFSIFHSNEEYDIPLWELGLQRRVGKPQLRVYCSKAIVFLSALAMVGLPTSSTSPPRQGHDDSHDDNLSFFVTHILYRPIDLLLCALEGPPLVLLLFSGSYIWGYGVAPCIMLVHFAIFMTRIWDCVIERPRSCWEKFDLIKSTEHIMHTPRISLLLGRKAWHELSLKGEHYSVKSARAILALFVIGALFIFTGALIQRSIDIRNHESAFRYYTESDYGTQDLEVPRIYVHVSVGTDANLLEDASTNITQTCWEGDQAGNPLPVPKCHVDTELLSNYRDSSLCKHDPQGEVPLYCETRVEIDFRFFERLEFPVLDLLKAVNIQMVGENVAVSDLSGLPSITLRKHDNFVGEAKVFLRENFKTNGFNAFGYGGSFNRFPVAEFPELRSDELYTKGDISSLRIVPSIFSTDVRIMREYNDHSILNIFANIGGLWTFVNGLFGLVFGGSLLYFLFGIKPLSRFGIVHLLSQKRFRRGTRENYPRFFEEGGQPGQPDAGVVAFIREHLLGVISDDQSQHSRASSPLDHPQSDFRDHEKFGPEGVWTSTGYNGGEGGSTERIPLTPRRLIIAPS